MSVTPSSKMARWVGLEPTVRGISERPETHAAIPCNGAETLRFSTVFWNRIDRSAGPDGCWLWPGRKDRDGYGIVYLDGRDQNAARVAFFLTHGHWPTPCCLHDCDNPPCVNPAHLHEGTQAQNMRERDQRGRGPKGARNGRYKEGLYVGGLHRPIVCICGHGVGAHGFACEGTTDEGLPCACQRSAGQVTTSGSHPTEGSPPVAEAAWPRGD